MQSLACDLWLMERAAFRQFASMVSVKIDAEQAKAAASVTPRRQKTVGVIPVHGVLEARPSFIGEMLGMSSYERVGQALDVLMYDEGISSVVFDIASPGGMVYGAPELGEKIFGYRGRKPMISVANPLAASGAYWPFTAADRMVVTSSGDVGSVGVIAEHVDISQSLERDGAKVTVIRSQNSPFKGEGTDVEPLSDEARAHMQGRADAIYQRFVSDLARFRGVSVAHVNEHFGKGRVVDAKAAIAAGMADRVGTLQDVVVKLSEGRIRINSERSQEEWDAPTLKERYAIKAAAIKDFAEEPKETETHV